MQSAVRSSKRPAEQSESKQPELRRPVGSLRERFGPIAIIAAFFLIAAVFISPAGNFPLNDDWMYSFAVKRFMEARIFEFVGPNCASCLMHVISGALVCAPFGFSHEVLRVFTFSLAFVSAVAVYALARELRVSRSLSTFGALTYSANPIFLNLAFSYMTDVSWLAFTSLSVLFTIQGVKRNSVVRFGLASVMLLVAIGIRQTAAALIATNVLLLAYLWLRGKHSWTVLLGLIAAPAVWFKLVDQIAPISTNHPMAYGWYQNHVNGIFSGLLKKPLPTLYELDLHTGEAAFYIALLLLPLLVTLAPRFSDLFKRKPRILGAWFVLSFGTCIATLMKFVVIDHNAMPFSQNLLRMPVLGTLAIMGINLPALSKQWKVVLTDVSAISAALLLAVLLAGLQRAVLLLWRNVGGRWKKRNVSSTPMPERFAVSTFLCCFSAVALLGLCVVQSSINDLDRYYVIPSAMITVFLMVTMKWLRIRKIWLVMIPCLVLLASYSLCAQQDYMSWNRARWAAASWLESKGISPAEIDGGAEYDFEHNHLLYNTRFRGAQPYCNWRWWSITGERYLVTFSPVPGYRQIAVQKYWSALTPFKKRELQILELGQ